MKEGRLLRAKDRCVMALKFGDAIAAARVRSPASPRGLPLNEK